MTGPEHYRAAENLLLHTELGITDQFGDGAECARQQLAMAQVHATLAVAAANAIQTLHSSKQFRAWREVLDEPEVPDGE